MLSESIRKILERNQYWIVGRHSAVKVCRWTKKALVDDDFCYKEQFYGIKSHECCQMSPWIACQNKCLHCWRPIELNFNVSKNKINDPKEIIEGCIAAQRKLLSGCGGNKKANRKKFKEAQSPSQFAISLMGESTLYPKLAEFISELRKQGKISFLVTNGLLPEKLEELEKKKALPTQLYLSLNYPNEKLFRKISKNKGKNSWKKFNETLELMKKLKTRRVIRLTLVRDLNMKDEMIEEYAKLIKKAMPDFIEIKGFVSVGFSRKRLGYERMPFHEEIKDYAEDLLKLLPDYKFLDEKKESIVVLLGKDRKKMKIKEWEI